MVEMDLSVLQKDISFSRIFRWVLACVMASLVYAFVFQTGIASAAYSGTLSVSENTYNEYQSTGSRSAISGLGLPDWTKLNIYNSSYNLPHYFQIEGLNWLDFPYEGRSTSFTITSGGSGTGWASYVQATKGVYWYFEEGSYATSDEITLSYTSNIFADVTNLMSTWWAGSYYGSPNSPVNGTNYYECGTTTAKRMYWITTVLSPTSPMSLNGIGVHEEIHYSGSSKCSIYYYGHSESSVGSGVSNSYTVTNIIDDLYVVDIEKSSQVETKIAITSYNGLNYVPVETDYNSDDLSVIVNVTNGLRINMSIETGAYDNEVIIYGEAGNELLFTPNQDTTNTTEINLSYSVALENRWFGDPNIYIHYHLNDTLYSFSSVENGLLLVNYPWSEWEDNGTIDLQPYILSRYNFSGYTVKIEAELFDNLVPETILASDFIIFNPLSNDTTLPNVSRPTAVPTSSPVSTAVPSQTTSISESDSGLDSFGDYLNDSFADINTSHTGISGTFVSYMDNITSDINYISSQLSDTNNTVSYAIIGIVCPCIIEKIPDKVKSVITLELILITVLIILRRK